METITVAIIGLAGTIVTALFAYLAVRITSQTRARVGQPNGHGTVAAMLEHLIADSAEIKEVQREQGERLDLVIERCPFNEVLIHKETK